MIYMVYEIKPDGEYSDFCKIGYTRSEKTIESRIKDMQTGNPNTLEVVFEVDGEGRHTEKFIHEELKDYHVRGEWFERIEYDLLYDVIQDHRSLYDDHSCGIIVGPDVFGGE